jgi:hypothetical protein
MRGLGWIGPFSGVTLALLAAAMAVPRVAAADTMDPALARLVISPAGCRTTGGSGGGVYYNPTSKFNPCVTDDAAFAQLIAQYGAAIAPSGMHSARTTGYGGFELSIEGAFTSIDNNAYYWQQGTQGVQDPSSKLFSTSNPNPPGWLQLYQLKITKGFPFGFELTGSFGYLAQTSIYTIGADVRWSLFEGFRTSWPAFFPELAVGGAVRTITGTDQFQLTVASADGEISKPFAIAGSVILTPWIGYQYLRIFGDSNLIDLTPNTDATNYCGFQGNKTPYNTTAPSQGGTGLATGQANDGQPICNGGTSADYNNTVVFQSARLNRHRIMAGLNLRIQMIKIGGQFTYDLVDPGSATTDQMAAGTPGQSCPAGQSMCNPYLGVQRQMTLAFDIGAVF